MTAEEYTREFLEGEVLKEGRIDAYLRLRWVALMEIQRGW